jgi:hypothetical protein
MGTELAAITPEQLLEKIMPGFEAYQLMADLFMAKVKFYDRTLTEWIDHLAIDIPKDMRPEDLRTYFIQVARNLQQVSYFYSVCSAYNSTLSSKADGEKANVVAKIVYDYANKNAKRPAATVLDQLAETYFNDVTLQLVISKVLKEFWRERRDTLVEVRKCLEQISMSQNMEMKYHEIT